MQGNNHTDRIHKANSELVKFSEWCLANGLTFNTTKTYYILFTNINMKYQPLPRLTILNEDILQVYKIKFLGILLIKNLTFKHRISNLCIKFSRAIALLVRIKNIVPIEIIKVMYYAHVYPYLAYCNPFGLPHILVISIV